MTSSTDIDVVITGSSSPAKLPPDHIAYFLVHSLAQSLYLATSVLKSLAISGTRGSSGFGSHSREHIDRSTWTGRVSLISSAQGNSHLGDGQCGRPLGAENVQTDGSVGVNVGMIDPRRECKFRRFEGIICREMDVEEENSTLVRRL